MVAELDNEFVDDDISCSLAKISMVAEPTPSLTNAPLCCSLAKISMVAERLHNHTCHV